MNKARLTFALMKRTDNYALLSAIKSSALLPSAAHAHALTAGFGSHLIIRTALLRSYAVSGDLTAAHQLFDETLHRDTIIWNALLAAYAQSYRPREAICAARAMVRARVRPNEITVVTVLSACCQSRALAQGKVTHAYAVKNLTFFDPFVYNALINMYATCGLLYYARKLFDRMPNRNVVSWTTMINAYSSNSRPGDAVGLFAAMESANLNADEATMISLVFACAMLCNSELGIWVDEYVDRNGFGESTMVANALIDMHCRCGDVQRACGIFERMRERTVVSWTVMIQGLAMHGQGVAALMRFSQMQRQGLRPDGVVFLAVLSACSHAGMVSEGKQCFRLMVEEYGLVPWMEHYGSVVDMLCRAGLTDEAFEFAESMPVRPDGVIWRTLIGACRDRGELGLARRVADHLLELEPEHSGNYIVKSNLHALEKEWDHVREVRNGMRIKGVIKKDSACSSFIEENYNDNIDLAVV